MFRLRHGLWALPFALLMAPSPALAVDYYNVCGFGSATGLKVCASADVFWSGSDLVLRVWNMEQTDDYDSEFGGHHTITAVGLDNTLGLTANSFSAEYFNGSSSTLTNWILGANSLQAELGSETKEGHKEGIVGCTDPDATGTQNHVSTCGSWPSSPYVRFTFSGLNDTNFSLNALTFEFHSQQIGPNNEDSAKGSCPAGECEVVPEPISMALLGTGLAGMGLARRRRRNGDVENA